MNSKDTMTFSLDDERKQYHERMKKRKITRLIIALILWAIVIFYFLTPFATYKMMHVTGNVYLSENEVIEYANIKNTLWFLVDNEKLKTKLEEHNKIEDASISFGINGLNIYILEKYPLAKRNDKYIMNTSFEPLTIDDESINSYKLIDISDLDDNQITGFAKNYREVDLDIREVFYEAKKESDKIIILKGNFDEDSYFEMKLNIDYLNVKLMRENFNNIKKEIIDKITNTNVKYDKDNPCFINYDLDRVDKYEIS